MIQPLLTLTRWSQLTPPTAVESRVEHQLTEAVVDQLTAAVLDQLSTAVLDQLMAAVLDQLTEAGLRIFVVADESREQGPGSVGTTVVGSD